MIKFTPITICVLLSMMASNAMAQVDSTQYYNLKAGYYNLNDKNVALQGYDVVAHHKNHKAAKGKKEQVVIHDEVNYYFQNGENKEAFQKSPEKYLPAYGGWCSFGVGMEAGVNGYKPGKYPVDPNSFKIIDGTLYLFYNGPEINALEYWNKDEGKLKKRADELWRKIGKK